MIPLRLLPQTVTVRNLTGTGANGAVYGPAYQLRCRVSVGHKLVRNSAGAEVTAVGTVHHQPTTTIPVGSKITLPGETRERTAIVMNRYTGARKEALASVDVQ